MKTFDKKDIITCINAEDAKKYIGKLGYFANGLNGFADIDHFAPYSLDNVQVGIDKPFFYREKNFALFLPEDKVMEIEEPKKWRPFEDTNELFDYLVADFNRGHPIRLFIRDKASLKEYHFLICGYSNDGIFLTTYGEVSMQYLFEVFELFNDHCVWQPFGVEE